MTTGGYPRTTRGYPRYGARIPDPAARAIAGVNVCTTPGTKITRSPGITAGPRLRPSSTTCADQVPSRPAAATAAAVVGTAR